MPRTNDTSIFFYSCSVLVSDEVRECEYDVVIKPVFKCFFLEPGTRVLLGG
jgi:hypothetical protein